MSQHPLHLHKLHGNIKYWQQNFVIHFQLLIINVKVISQVPLSFTCPLCLRGDHTGVHSSSIMRIIHRKLLTPSLLHTTSALLSSELQKASDCLLISDFSPLFFTISLFSETVKCVLCSSIFCFKLWHSHKTTFKTLYQTRHLEWKGHCRKSELF